ncbi:Xyloglucan endo-transglycosylase C-terminal [Arabidopsis suecica]|uniref:Xyloglucan endotransglucosylase/hydrolase n=1 Tax=Arabidopsis suecica TaxID=45249 RepID=A0A8T1YL67_ARASU|nr:Xyloglucan endo-transglycosylase C-terminal [Arabidopsis suecica]
MQTSNGDVFVKNHDELDIEFLGNLEGKPWRFQTNMYGNGSTNRGREERYRLWFDPSKEFHRYSILWTPTKIIFWVDDVPIREIIRKEEMEGDYPQKPMSLYATIWDASSWATSGGKFGVDYTFSPFVSEFKDIALDGCNVSDSLPGENNNNNIGNYNNINCSVSDQFLMTNDYSTISPKQAAAMRRFRERYMYYSYCYDTIRYSVPPPECVIVTAEKNRFRDTGRLKFGGSHPKVHKARKRRRRNRSTPVVSADL